MPSTPQAAPDTVPRAVGARITILLVEDHDMVAEAIGLEKKRDERRREGSI